MPVAVTSDSCCYNHQRPLNIWLAHSLLCKLGLIEQEMDVMQVIGLLLKRSPSLPSDNVSFSAPISHHEEAGNALQGQCITAFLHVKGKNSWQSSHGKSPTVSSSSSSSKFLCRL